jgi:hypothetical protein
MPGFLTRTTALVAVGVALLSGCTGKADSGAAVSASDLQKSIVDRLAQAGTPSTWVSCPKDLPGRIGATTRCDVKFGTGNTVTALLTTTGVIGGKATWEVTGPELTKDQVTQRVAGLTSAQSTTCDSGLHGHPGDWVQCQVTANGVTLNQTVEVKDATGLSLDLALTPAIPKQQTEALLRNRLVAKYGRPFESATCPGDLAGGRGATMDCVTTSAGREETYTLVVTDIGKGTMNFEVAERPAPGAGVPRPAPFVGVPGPAPVFVPEPAPVFVPAPAPVFVPAPAPVFVPEPAPVFVPEPAPVFVPAPAPVFVPEPAPVFVPEPAPVFVPEPAPVEVVPQLPQYSPHLPSGEGVPAPGPFAIQAGGGQVITQAAGG